MKDRILIRNARQHNLKGVDLEIPRRALVVMTGPSGSGKSSLAFDTLYAEGQRRYVESLSTYAKQFLDRMEKPAVDAIDGLSPAVAIEQKNPTKTSRSTVGTATEAYDFMRLLWARTGRTHCPECDRRVIPDTVQTATDAVMALPEGSRLLVTFPLARSENVKHLTVLENLRALGFMRVMAGERLVDLDEPGMEDTATAGIDLAVVEDLRVVADRLILRADMRDRVADSIGTAFHEGEGEVVVIDPAAGTRLNFSERFHCPEHPEIRFLEPTPRLFSFNNPYGSCPECTGFGAILEYDPELIVPNASRTLKDGAVDPWEKPRYKRYRSKLLSFAKDQGVPANVPWRELPKGFRDTVIHGKRRVFQGVIPFLRSREEKRYKQYIRVFLRQYQSAQECEACRGSRLRGEALNVRVGGLDIGMASRLPIRRLREWLQQLADGGTAEPLTDQELGVARPIATELGARIAFLDDVGLGYLTMDRQARTLSGGEAQRISLANSLGSHLTDTLYVLDEPTIGLHPRDTDRLLALLAALRDRGNSVVVVEHDPAAIAAGDHVVELGPGSGEKGGTIVFTGTYAELEQADTATGRYVSGREPMTPAGRRRTTRNWLKLKGARLHNVKGVDIAVPLGEMTVVTGVSGSGKSTLVHDVLYRALESRLADGDTSAKRHLGEAVGHYDDIEGVAPIDGVVLVDQAPIGKSHRSNPVTYIKAFDHVRSMFAQQPLAKQRGYGPGHFSFNVKGGRCEDCQGEGVVQVEMVFLADVFLPCDVCGGKRYRRETLDVKVKGLDIRQVLDLTVDEAIRFFIREDRLGQMLWQLQQVGLGYLRLGQPAPTLSGGEAQRLKIARELIGAHKKRGSRLYVLDEPTTGLSGNEVRKLIGVLRRLTDGGHTVVLIEHNVDAIAAADWIIDMGPEAGDEGGRVVAMGRPEEVAAAQGSHTARYLRDALATAQARATSAT
ncbi:MAG TPA: excinuclease ABC subunit UvrA [Longimicrobiales bacterium]|nr:excinuclease ABC subunit UvrA [Longimicrobiales bacterium]